MKTDKYLFAAAALTVLTACSSDYDFSENGDMERIPVTLGYKTLTTTETRAAQNLNEGTFDSGEQVSVFISQTDQNSWTEYTYQTIADGAMIPSGTIPYYSNDYNYDIAAFYPQLSGETFSIQTDQTTDAAYKQSDLMYASVINQARQHAPVTLDFKHKMAKICVNATPGDGVGAITGVKLLNVKPEVLIDKAGNATLTTHATTDVTMSNFGVAVIPSQAVSGDFLAVTTTDGTATYRFDDNIFDSGLLYTLNVTVEASAIGNVTTMPVSLTSATASHLGWLITNDGYIYRTASAIPADKTPVAMICYVGEPGTADHSNHLLNHTSEGYSTHTYGFTLIPSNGGWRGLAIALKDAATDICWCTNEGNDECYTGYGEYFVDAWGYASDNDPLHDYPEIVNLDPREDLFGIKETMATLDHIWKDGHTAPAAEAAVSNNGTPSPVGTTGWFMPASGQLELIARSLMQGADYDAATINAWFTTTGLDASAYDVLSGNYWTSTINRQSTWETTIIVHSTDTGIANSASNINATASVRSIVAF